MDCTILLTLNRGAELRPIQCKTSGNTGTGGCRRGMKRTGPCESTTYGCTAMTANELRKIVSHFVSARLFTASLDHFQVLDTILRSINVKIICRIEWILKTYSKTTLLFMERKKIFFLSMIETWRVKWSYSRNCKLKTRRPVEEAFELHTQIIPRLTFFLQTPPCLMDCT